MPVSEPDIPGDASRDDPELLRLLQAIALGDGFQVHFLVCDSPWLARSAIALLKERVGGKPCHLDPYSAMTGREALSAQKLAAAILSPLTEPGPEVAAASIVVVDASRATGSDGPAWEWLFQRLNERRNVIAGRLHCSLVLAVTPALEVAFAHQAPDFWSIRSASVRMSVGAPDVSFAGPEATKAGREISYGLEWEGAPEATGSSTIRVEAIQKSRTGLREKAGGSLARARIAFEESLALRRRLFAAAPRRDDRAMDLSIGLEDLGEVLVGQGALEDALKLYRESAAILQDLLERDPSRVERLRALAVNLERVGDAHRSSGALAEALAAYTQSLDYARRLLALEPSRPEPRRDLSAALMKLGDLQLKMGAHDTAGKSYEEALSNLRHLSLQGRTDSSRDLAAVLDRLGDRHRYTGELDRALALYLESLDRMRKLVALDPNRAEWQRDLSVSLEKVGDVRRSRGELGEALVLYRECLELRRRLLALDPSRLRRRLDLVAILERLAATTEEAGEAESALRLYEEGLEAVRDLRRHFPASTGELGNLPARLARKVASLSHAPS